MSGAQNKHNLANSIAEMELDATSPAATWALLEHKRRLDHVDQLLCGAECGLSDVPKVHQSADSSVGD